MRLVGTDIDGTILPSSGRFSARTRDALAALEPAGIGLALITARPPRWVDAVADQLNISGEALCANGAVTYDLATRRIVDAQTIPQATLLAAAAALRKVIPGVVFGLETTSGLAIEPGFGSREPGVAPREEAPLEQMQAIRDSSAFKMLAIAWESDSDRMLRAAQPVVGTLLEASHSSAEVPLIELAPQGITKGVGLERAAAHHGVARADVIAFGDAPNDLPMLRWAGYSYAVSNAHQDVLAAADEVIGSVDEDAVAQVLERLVA